MWGVSEREDSKMTARFWCPSNWKEGLVLIRAEDYRGGAHSRRSVACFDHVKVEMSIRHPLRAG